MNLTHVAGPKKGGLNVDYDQSIPSLPINQRSVRHPQGSTAGVKGGDDNNYHRGR